MTGIPTFSFPSKLMIQFMNDAFSIHAKHAYVKKKWRTLPGSVPAASQVSLRTLDLPSLPFIAYLHDQ